MLWGIRTCWWCAVVMQFMPTRGSYLPTTMLPLSCYRCVVVLEHLFLYAMSDITESLNWLSFRRCYEAYNWWALGSFGLCHMDSWLESNLHLVSSFLVMLVLMHLWTAETCLSDVKRMEPIDGQNKINKVHQLDISVCIFLSYMSFCGGRGFILLLYTL